MSEGEPTKNGLGSSELGTPVTRRERLLEHLSELYNPFSNLLPLDMPLVSDDDRSVIIQSAEQSSNKGIKKLIRQRKMAINKHRRKQGPDQRWPILH